MTWSFSFVVLAAADKELIKILIAAAIVAISAIMKSISSRREQAEKARPAKPPNPTPKRDDRFRNEIEVFLEEVGRRRSPADSPPRPAAQRVQATVEPVKPQPPSRPELRRAVGPARRSERGKRASETKAAPVVPATGPHARPGAEIASRKPPLSDGLGAQVREHLVQYLDASRMKQQVQADIGNAVEQAVRTHLGQTVTHGTSDAGADRASPPSGSHPIVSMLRDPAGVRRAIVINEVLGRPMSLRHKS